MSDKKAGRSGAKRGDDEEPEDGPDDGETPLEEDPVDAALANADPNLVGLDTEDLELGAFEADPDDPRYDPDGGEHLEYWLDMDEGERLVMVQETHLRDKLPFGENLYLHAAVHVVVENLIAAGDPRVVRLTLERFLKAGVPRHDAVHAIGTAVFELLGRPPRPGRQPMSAGFEKAVAALDPKEWIPRR